MKVLIDHGTPFQLAHGGYQIQMEETKRALEEIGVDVEWLRWWDSTQRADVIHAFAPVDHSILIHSAQKGIPTILTTLFTSECNMPSRTLKLKKIRRDIFDNIPGVGRLFQQLPHSAFHLCTQNVVGLHVEQHLLEKYYNVPTAKCSIIPYGLMDVFFEAAPSDRTGDYLITQGTITERKNSVELAQLAHEAKVPILFVGKAYSPTDPYWHRFQSLVDGRWVRYQEHVSDQASLIKLLQKARGFVLLSDIENWCLSAHEAAACGLPLLVPRMNWSIERFGNEARYFNHVKSGANAALLRSFYEDSISLPIPKVRQWTWREVAEKLRAVYEQALESKRPS